MTAGGALALLPVSALTDAAVSSAFSCSPSQSAPLSRSDCSGHGRCYVLLDPAAPDSAALLNASSAPALPLSSFPPLELPAAFTFSSPTAVCVCASGYTGYGDFISQPATSGSACLYQTATLQAFFGLYAAGFTLLLGLALFKLLGWWRSLQPPSRPASLAPRARELQSPPRSGKSVTGQQQQQRDAAAAGAGRAVVSPRVVSASEGQRDVSAVSGSPAAGGEAAATAAATNWSAEVLKIAFVYPTLAALIAVLALGICLTRAADSSAVIGRSVGLSVAELLVAVLFNLLIALGVYSHTRLALSVTRLYVGGQLGLATLLLRLRVGSAVVVLATLLLWLPVCTVLLLAPDWAQQTTTLLFTIGALPSWLLGAAHVATTRRIQATLLLGTQKLSQAQRESRLRALAKIGGHSCGARLGILLNVVGCVLGSSWPALRQYAELLLFVQWTTVLLIVSIRLAIISPAGARGPAVAAADEPYHRQPPLAPGKPLSSPVISPRDSHTAITVSAASGAAQPQLHLAGRASAADSGLQLSQ